MKREDGSWDQVEDYVLDFAIERMRAGERVAIVTLVHIEGSSPRPLGAQMAISEAAQWVGHLSGGCVERAVAAEAVQAIREGKNRIVRYGRGSRYLDIRLPCGSAIDLVFDVRASLTELEAIDNRLRQRRSATMVIPQPGPSGSLEQLRSRTYLPRRRLVVFGVGPVAIQLARLARIAGFDIVLCSPDGPTLRAVEALGADVVRIFSPVALPRIDADFRTAVVFAFHDHDWEEKLLPPMLGSAAFYVGAMGGKATHRARLGRLESMGLPSEQLVRLVGPAGLLPQARNAADIALSILAQVVEAEGRTGSVALLDRTDRRNGAGQRRGASYDHKVEAHL